MVFKQMKIKITIFTLILGCIILLTGCGKKETIPEEYSKLLSDKTGKTIRLGFYGMPEQTDPIKAAESDLDQIFCSFIYASPLRKLNNGSYEPYLLENYQTSLDGDKLVFKGQWRQNLKWHDGKNFDVSDFDFTLSQMVLPDRNSPYSESAKNIISIRNDQGSLEIVFPDRSKKNLDMLCAGILPAHILKKENIASGTVEDAYNTFINNPIGLGPYKLAKNQDLRYMLLEPDVNFYDQKGSNRPKIVIACSHELQQLISDFRENMFDWINAPSMIAEYLQNLNVEDTVYVEYQNPALLTWVFNTKNEKLEDVKIRRALNLILDRDFGKQSFGSSFTEYFDNLIPVDNSKINKDERFEEAKKLLSEAGAEDKNGDGIREYKGKDFKINIVVNNDNVTRRRIAEKIIERMKSIGILAELESVPWNEFLSEKLKKGNYETALLSYHINNDCSLKNLFKSRTGDDSNNLNFTGINDSSLDYELDVLDSAITSVEDKNAAYKNVNEKLSQLCPCAFILKPNNLVLIHGKVNTVKKNISMWEDVANWKLMFGTEDSKL